MTFTLTSMRPRLPIETVKSVRILTADLERRFLEECDDWQFPVFLTLMLTGLRPGELTHLHLPEDLDLDAGVLRVSNKPKLHWQVKTRNEREIPVLPVLVRVLHELLGERKTGPVFLRRRFAGGVRPLLAGKSQSQLEQELRSRISNAEQGQRSGLSRTDAAQLACGLWRDAGIIKTERIRIE